MLKQFHSCQSSTVKIRLTVNNGKQNQVIHGQSPSQSPSRFPACFLQDTFSPPNFRISLGERLYLIKAVRLVVPTDGRPEQSAEWSVFVAWFWKGRTLQ